MQLFLSDYIKKDATILVESPELLSQLRKVLRAKIGDTIRIQNPKHETKKTRYELRIEFWDDSTLEGTIISEYIHESEIGKKSMIIAMPNKGDKVELIAQKLTECGIDHIIFRPSERSVIKERNEKKAERIHKIIKEAVEQSRGRTVPELHFTTNITEYLKNTEVIVFDKIGAKEQNIVPISTSHVTGIIGPEGGLTPRDYKVFETYQPKIVGLGDTVLRIETAAIIGGWILTNNFK